MKIDSEKLAYWYLRLNGFFTTTNFIVHPDFGSNQRTEIDILGIRLPFRSEMLVNSFKDDDYFTGTKDKPYIVILEVKKGICKLNTSWREKNKQNMERILKALGPFPEPLIPTATDSLYSNGFYDSTGFYVSFFCIGGSINTNLKSEYPKVEQVLWEQVLKFIYNRFKLHRERKVSHGQWDEEGKALWDCFDKCSTEDNFITSVEIVEGF